MDFKLEQIGEVMVAQVCEDTLATNNVQDFKSMMSDLFKPDAKIVLDMSCLKFVDSAGIGALLSCVKNTSLSKGALRLCNVTTQVRNLFELVRVHRFLQVFNTLDEAVRSFDQ
jgi:anti-sigma B factor antagonist